MAETINHEDLRTFSKLGAALWGNPEYSKKLSTETLAAASVMRLTPDRTLERAAAGLLERARNEGMAANTQLNRDVLTQQFFRLTPEERFVLVTLHSGKWSYARIGRVLGLSPANSNEEVQELAYSARLQLCLSVSYPGGPSSPGPYCPHYDLRKPWTQRWMDQEIEARRDQLFIQGHLVRCKSCSQALARFREVYFKVEHEVARIIGKTDFADTFEAVLAEGPFQCYPSERSFKESLRIFLRRKDIQFALGGLLILVFLKLAHLMKG